MKLLGAAAVLGCLAGGTANTVKEAVRAEMLASSASYSFNHYTKEFGKVYGSAKERAYRKKVFNERRAEIHAHNQKGKSYQKGVNFFTDHTEEEMDAYKGYNTAGGTHVGEAHVSLLQTNGTGHGYGHGHHFDESQLPTDVDWRTQISGWTEDFGQVQNQGSCGSCWAFAATAVFEAHVAKESEGATKLKLAEQELVDCAPNPEECGGTGGCQGATSEIGFQLIKDKGHVLTSDLDYVGKTHQCSLAESGSSYEKAAATMDSFVTLESNDYNALMEAIATKGPVTISVDADTWSSYSSGVFDPELSPGANIKIDHAVSLAGYGEDNGVKYWLVRNSWGPNWGEKGHIRIKRSPSIDGKGPCWTDVKPCDGIACDKKLNKETGKVYSECTTSVEVCGTCGIWYMSSYPVGAKVV